MKRYLFSAVFFILPLWTLAHNGVDDGDEIATSSWLHPPPAPDVIYQVHHVQTTTSHIFVDAGMLLFIVLLIGAMIFWKKRRKNLS